jgi:eukaryotic-like serine/threonine-protein kinase
LVLTVIDTEGSRQLETVVIEGRRSSALSLQDGAVMKLSNVLSLRIEPGQIDPQDGIPIAPGAQEFYLQARGYLQRSDKRENIDTAVLLFQRALEADSEYALSYAGLGEAYWRLYERTSDPKWVQQALKSCQAARRLNDQNAEVQVTLGRVYAGIGRYDDAIARFQAALEFDRRSGEAFEGLAQAYARLGNLDLAEATYHKAVSMRPGDWRAYHQLGRFYFSAQRFEEAIEPFRRVTALTPDNAQGYLNLGAALHAAGRLEEARAMYDRSIAIEPKPVAFSNVGKLLYDQGRYEEAARRFEQAASLKKNDFQIWGNLAAAYDQLGDSRAAQTYRRAATLTQQALQVNPKQEELYSRLAFYFAGAGDHEPAESWLAKAAGRQTADALEMARNAATCEKLGQREQASRWIEKALKQGIAQRELAKFQWLSALISEPRFERSAGAN